MITPETVLMGFLTIIAIFIVSRDVLNISFSIEFTIFSAGCIFPTTFSVEAAFDRREVDTMLFPSRLNAGCLVQILAAVCSENVDAESKSNSNLFCSMCLSEPSHRIEHIEGPSHDSETDLVSVLQLAMERLAKLKATIVALFSQFIFLDQSRTGAAVIQASKPVLHFPSSAPMRSSSVIPSQTPP
jgi:hypothetical protein